METVAIRSKKPFSPDTLKKVLSEHWPVEDSSANTIVVHGPTSRAYLSLDPDLNGPTEFCLQIDYSDVEFVKSLIQNVADSAYVIVDNDFGTVLPGNDFVSRCKAEKGWDWRRKPSVGHG